MAAMAIVSFPPLIPVAITSRIPVPALPTALYPTVSMSWAYRSTSFLAWVRELVETSESPKVMVDSSVDPERQRCPSGIIDDNTLFLPSSEKSFGRGRSVTIQVTGRMLREETVDRSTVTACADFSDADSFCSCQHRGIIRRCSMQGARALVAGHSRA